MAVCNFVRYMGFQSDPRFLQVSWMMMSMRSIMFDDLLTTQQLQFSTVVIQNRDGEDDDNSAGVVIE